MAIFHCSVTTISRGAGQSVIAAAAYRHACKLVDERTGQVHDYTRKQGLESSSIYLPKDAGEEWPAWATDRNKLWNKAEAAERRKNSRVGREITLALPAELSPERRKTLAGRMAQALADRYGVAVDVAIHLPGREGDQRNHHAHMLMTTRRITPEGLGVKVRELDDQKQGPQEVEYIRGEWERQANLALGQAGFRERIDHRSLKAQGIERAATCHMGPSATALERRGVVTYRGNYNRAVAVQNHAFGQLRRRHEALGKALVRLQERQKRQKSWARMEEQARAQARKVSLETPLKATTVEIYLRAHHFHGGNVIEAMTAWGGNVGLPFQQVFNREEMQRRGLVHGDHIDVSKLAEVEGSTNADGPKRKVAKLEELTEKTGLALGRDDFRDFQEAIKRREHLLAQEQEMEMVQSARKKRAEEYEFLERHGYGGKSHKDLSLEGEALATRLEENSRKARQLTEEGEAHNKEFDDMGFLRLMNPLNIVKVSRMNARAKQLEKRWVECNAERTALLEQQGTLEQAKAILWELEAPVRAEGTAKTKELERQAALERAKQKELEPYKTALYEIVKTNPALWSYDSRQAAIKPYVEAIAKAQPKDRGEMLERAQHALKREATLEQSKGKDREQGQGFER